MRGGGIERLNRASGRDSATSGQRVGQAFGQSEAYCDNLVEHPTETDYESYWVIEAAFRDSDGNERESPSISKSCLDGGR